MISVFAVWGQSLALKVQALELVYLKIGGKSTLWGKI